MTITLKTKKLNDLCNVIHIQYDNIEYRSIFSIIKNNNVFYCFLHNQLQKLFRLKNSSCLFMTNSESMILLKIHKFVSHLEFMNLLKKTSVIKKNSSI